MMYDAVIFDLDGVIIDSETFYCREIYNFLEREGYPITPETSYRFSGLSPARGEALMKELLGESLGTNLWQKHMEQVLDHPLDYKSIATPGVTSLLQFLKLHSFKIGLASSGIRESVLNVLSVLGIKEYFDFVITGDDVQNSKPDPEIYLRAADHLNTITNRCIIIEDSTPGITAGIRSGAYVIAKKENRFNQDQTLAHIICSDMYEIKNHIRFLNTPNQQ